MDGHNELTFTSSRQKSKQYHFSVESLSPYEEKLAMLIKLQVNTGFRIVFKPETNAFTISIGRTPIILVESHLSVEAMPRFTMPGLLALNERNLESLGNAMTCYSLVESRRQNTVVCANGQLIRNNDGLFVYALGSPAPSMPENLGSLLDYGQVQGWLSGDYALLFRAGIPDEVRQIGEIDNQPEPCDGKSRQKRRRKRKQGTSQSASQSASSTHTRRYDKPPSSKRKRVKGGGSNNGGNNPNERPTNYDKESPTSEPDEEALLREQLKNLEILIRKNEQHREYLKKDDPTIDPRQALSNRWVRDRIGPIIDGLKQQRQEAQERLSQILDPSSTTQKPETKEN